jgi:peptidyl-Lys metalloendopeptidase
MFKTTVKATTWALGASLLAAAPALHAAAQKSVDVRLSIANPVVQGDVDVVIKVTITNTARHPVMLLSWQLPSDELDGPLFRITRDNQKVGYLGPIVKRGAPQASDRIKLDPGASLSYDVELTGAYDLSASGRYAIEYASRGKHGDAISLGSDTLYVWLEGRSAKRPAPPPPPGGSGITYTGNCSASQQTALQAAVGAATNYATQASTYLASTPPSGTLRYTTWFGAYAPDRWNTVQSHFANEQSAFSTQPLTLDCKCKKPNVYAYVYPTQPYKIYLCGAFWSAPMTGTDSKGGTLIHEMSHFTVVAGTEDWAYGQSAAAALAISDPAKALDNADSHEYFAENTPALP